MEVLLPIIIGFCATFVSTLLPGLLNITAAKIGVREGRRNAMIFSSGAATVVFIQAYIAVTFARLISGDPEIIYYLEEGGVLVFIPYIFYFYLKRKNLRPLTKF
jgi:threonine/homoserine/homoserine lactone efflux protein